MSLHLIALHGAGMNAQVWGGMAPHLAAGGYGAAFQPVTLPGHRSGDDPTALLDSIDAMAAWLGGMIDDVPEGRDVVLIGHSMGAAVAFAAANHARVRAVVAIATGARLPVNADLLALAHADPATAQAMIVKWGCDAKHPHVDAVRQIVTQVMQHTPPAALGVDLAACNAMLPAAPCGKKTLVISARFDKMAPVEQGRALADLHGGEYVVIDGGHMLPCEHAPEVSRALLDFLGRV